MKIKIFLLTVLSLLFASLTTGALAADLSVRLGQPKTPTNQNNLKLTFVVLEIGGTNNISVGCYKKSPSDANFVKFEDLTLIPGGNTGYCTVDSNILNNAGSYSFKIIANSTDSNIVTVDYNTSGPGTPGSYSKEKINDCDYKIKFKTADDGKTVKVELYRSDTTSISIDPGSRVVTQSIGPNTEGQIVNSVPVCTKEYFYALRAVDNADNVSGLTGDDFTTVTYTTTTGTTTGTTPSAIAIGTGSQVTNPDGTVGDNGEVSPTPESAEDVTIGETPTPEVLGAETSKWSNLKWLSIPLVLLAAYFLIKSKKRA